MLPFWKGKLTTSKKINSKWKGSSVLLAWKVPVDSGSPEQEKGLEKQIRLELIAEKQMLLLSMVA